MRTGINIGMGSEMKTDKHWDEDEDMGVEMKVINSEK